MYTKNKVVGVCILNWDGIKYTAPCLVSLIKQDYGAENINIYALDQGSTDGSLQWLKKLDTADVIQLFDEEKNIGFSSGNNKLMKAAIKDGCEYILIFNNDTRAFPDMISTMVKCFNDNKDCGAVGVPAYEYDHGKTSGKEAKRLWGIGGWLRRDDEMIKYDAFGKYWTDNHIKKCVKCGTKMPLSLEKPSFVNCPKCKWNPYEELYIPCDYVGGGCLMLSKEVIEKVGMFDTQFDPLYEEDVDLCTNIRYHGYQVIHVEKSGFNHAVSAFTSGYKRPEFWEIHKQNKAKFVRKWGELIDKGKV